MDGADVDYLESKRTVDERARSRRVRDRLLDALPEAPTVVDVGAGTGSMLRALLEWGVTAGTYRGIDRAEGPLEHARRTLPEALSDRHEVVRGPSGFEVDRLAVGFETGDVLDLESGEADLVVAQALLDLVPVVEAMDAIERGLRPGGLAYLPITFDGVSVFLPGRPDDAAVVEAYHAAIDEVPGRECRAGRQLLEDLQGRDGAVLAVGPSDWIVRPVGGAYPADEAYFVECVLGFVQDALADRDVDAADWLAARRDQLESGTLQYLAHNYDVLYRSPP